MVVSETLCARSKRVGRFAVVVINGENNMRCYSKRDGFSAISEMLA